MEICVAVMSSFFHLNSQSFQSPNFQLDSSSPAVWESSLYGFYHWKCEKWRVQSKRGVHYWWGCYWCKTVAIWRRTHQWIFTGWICWKSNFLPYSFFHFPFYQPERWKIDQYKHIQRNKLPWFAILDVEISIIIFSFCLPYIIVIPHTYSDPFTYTHVIWSTPTWHTTYPSYKLHLTPPPHVTLLVCYDEAKEVEKFPWYILFITKEENRHRLSNRMRLFFCLCFCERENETEIHTERWFFPFFDFFDF